MLQDQDKKKNISICSANFKKLVASYNISTVIKNDFTLKESKKWTLH